MGTDHNIHVGHYVRARGPKYLGGDCPFDDWLIDGDGQECLSEMSNNCAGPFKDGWRGWRDNVGRTCALLLSPPYESTGVWKAPPNAPRVFATAFEDALLQLRENYREVEICYGVVYYAY